MIYDTIKNAHLYKGLSGNLDTALDYITSTDFAAADEGTVEVDGRNVYAMISPYTTADTKGREYESHENYIDLQYVVSGSETMICRGFSGLEVTKPYNPEKDVCMYSLTEGDSNGLPYAGGTEVRMTSGDFVVLFPEDAHVPKVMTLKPGDVLKVVVKVRVE